jgi:hypothetical protein
MPLLLLLRVTETSVTVQPGRPSSGSTALGIYRYTRAGAALTLLPVIATYRMEGTVSGGVITLQEPHGDGSFTTLVFKR